MKSSVRIPGPLVIALFAVAFLTILVFADIWHDPSDGLEPYVFLKALEKPGIHYSYWIENTLKCYLKP